MVSTVNLILALECLVQLVSCQLKVIQPSTLVAAMEDGSGTIEASLGNFGHIMYGSTIIGSVLVPKRWDPENPGPVNNYGCEPLSWGDFPDLYSTNTEEERGALMLFIMLDRGQCSNVVKVRNVENFGGAVALIADYKDESVDNLIMTDYAGSGYSLTIPGFMIEHDAS